MGLFKKKADPISERARVLNDEIAALEAKIQQLGGALHEQPPSPRLRSTSAPGHAPLRPGDKNTAPVFEGSDYKKLTSLMEPEVTPQHFNELGVRKYDLAGALHRLKNYFRGQSPHNPKLVSYLAA